MAFPPLGSRRTTPIRLVLYPSSIFKVACPIAFLSLYIFIGHNLGQQNMWDIIHARAKSFKNCLVPLNSNSQEPALPTAVTNSVIHNSNSSPGVFMQIGDALKSLRIMPWLNSIVKFFFNYLNVSPINVHVREASDGMNPITSLFQSQEMAKTVLGLVVPIAGLPLTQSKDLELLQSRFITIALYLGFVATFNGRLLKGMCPRAANVMEKLGVALILLSFFRISSLIYMPAAEWVSWVGFAFICVPLIMSLLPINTTHIKSDPADPPNNMV